MKQKFLTARTARLSASVGLLLAGTLGASHYLKAADTYSLYDINKSYPNAATTVIYNEPISGGGYYVAMYKNSWWLGAGVHPELYPATNGWVQKGEIIQVTNLTDLNGTTVPAPKWNVNGSYVGGNVVSKAAGQCFKAKWWSQGQEPGTGASPWESATCPVGVSVANPWVSMPSSSSSVTVIAPPSPGVPVSGAASSSSAPASTGITPAQATNIPLWSAAGVYLENSVVKYTALNASTYCYRAKWWTQGNEPKPAAQLKNLWDSPWEQKGESDCPSMPVAQSSQATVAGSSATHTDVQTLPSAPTTGGAAQNTAQNTTPVIPPVIAAGVPPTQAIVGAIPTELPATGYAFLRNVTAAQWDWLFPLRSGRYNVDGGTRNTAPFAKPDGSTDVFTLNNFKKAVLAYNQWAKQSQYKQFLNEGTELQQAEEFSLFWAKSSRETSGSWSGAPAPWIVNDPISGTTWKGGLYWVEEVGYTTDPITGKSPAINYVDAGSTEYPPAEGRSYYGRGPIQLSWNYNYGAFGQWMHRAGMFPDVIKSPTTLLEFPNLVADNGAISIMSAAWFWMTPQGAKPSSHDVLFGEGSGATLSRSTQDQGLPKTNDAYVPKIATGHTTDPEVFSNRMGAIINIVNGGIECNRAAAWHPGPGQRVSYYAAYMKYFNTQHGLAGTIVPDAVNVWDQKISSSSPRNLQNATCFDQKSYYGW